VSTIFISIGVGLLTFLAGIVGLLLQRRLPDQHMSNGSRDMIGAIVGLVSLLLALVLGTLVGSAYGFYALQKTEVESLAARAVQLDLALSEFGADAAPIRAGLKNEVSRAHDLFLSGNASNASELELAAYIPALRHLDESIASLSPTTALQRQAMSSIGVNASFIEQTRMAMSLQLASPISWPLLNVVVSWALLLFCGFGVLSRLNSTSVAALGLGAFAVASAIFLILELNQPYSGPFHIPPAAVEQALAALGK
jgi:hypothetical protein